MEYLLSIVQSHIFLDHSLYLQVSFSVSDLYAKFLLNEYIWVLLIFSRGRTIYVHLLLPVAILLLRLNLFPLSLTPHIYHQNLLLLLALIESSPQLYFHVKEVSRFLVLLVFFTWIPCDRKLSLFFWLPLGCCQDLRLQHPLLPPQLHKHLIPLGP